METKFRSYIYKAHVRGCKGKRVSAHSPPRLAFRLITCELADCGDDDDDDDD